MSSSDAGVSDSPCTPASSQSTTLDSMVAKEEKCNPTPAQYSPRTLLTEALPEWVY